MQPESIVVDRLDRLLLQALQLDGRIPFARFAHLMGVSEQTAARRYRRLFGAGITRVIGLVDPAALGQSSWNVRIRVRPGAAPELCEVLARRPDVGWVTLTSGGSEIICVVQSRTSQLRDELLLRRLPGTVQVIGLSAHAILHRFDLATAWSPGPEQLEGEIRTAILAQAVGGGLQSANTRSGPEDSAGSAGSVASGLTGQDELLFAELARDGRAPVVRLASVTGWTPARVNRRMDELVRAGLLYFDTEIAAEALGFHEQAFLWLTVAPAHLRAVGEAVATMPEVAFVAATTGASNLVLSSMCTDTGHLFRFVTDGLGALPAVRTLEISPFLRRFKQAGTMVSGDRLVVGAGTIRA